MVQKMQTLCFFFSKLFAYKLIKTEFTKLPKRQNYSRNNENLNRNAANEVKTPRKELKKRAE